MKHKRLALPYSAMLIITSFLLSSRVSAADTTPDAFSFGSLDGVPLNTLLYSNSITVTGIDAPAPISITGGEYSINGGAFTANPGMVSAGQTVVVEQTSANAYATPTTATLTIDTVSSGYTVTTDPVDLTPDQFAFTPQANVPLDTVVESNPITISGLAGATWANISGGEYSVNGQPFTSNGGYVNNGDVIKVRLTSSADPSTLTWATFSAHWVYADFFAQTIGATTADQFSFTPQTDVALSTQVESNPIKISGLSGQTAISISGGEYSINGGAFRQDATGVQNDDVITVRQTSSDKPSTATTATLTVGSTSADFNVTTAATVTSGSFSFTPQTDVALGATVQSNAITVSGLTDPSAPISVTGGMYSINGGAYTADPGTVANGDNVTVQQTASSNWATQTTATLTIGTTSSDFVVSTPSTFTFTSQYDVPLNTSVESSHITVYGNPDPVIAISVTNGEYSINGGAYTADPGTVLPGDDVAVRQATSANYSTTTTTTLALGKVVGTFDTTTLAAPAVDPVDPFTFNPQTNVPLNTTVDSNSITVSGLTNPSAPISIVGGTYSVNGGAFTNVAGTVVNGDTVVVEQTSAATFSTTTTATLTIDGGSADFNVTTLAADITPDPFSFTPQVDVPLSAVVDSNPITVTGIDAPSPISVFAGSYSINGGAFTTLPGTVNNGDTVIVEQTASPMPSITTTATLTIDSVNADFNVTTIAADITPDPFSFTPQVDVPLSTVVDSNPITVTGIDSQAPINITGGLYSINGALFTNDPGYVHLGDTVVVQQTSSASPLITTTATLAIDSVNADFNVTTLAADITPDPFSFTPQVNVPLSTIVDSNPITVTGINAPSPISVNNGSYSINGGAFTNAAGTVNNGDTVIVEQTSSSNFSITTTATLTIDSVNADFNVTTAALDTTPDAFSFTPQTNVALGASVNSNQITVTGINAPTPISIVGGTYSVNGGTFTSAAGTVNNGDTVVVEQTASASFSTTTTATLTIDGVSADFNVTTAAEDTTPDLFTFTSQTGVPLNTPIDSNTITVSGINAPVSISVNGGTYSVNGGVFTSAAGTVNNGDTVTVRLMSSSSFATQTTATLIIDGVSSDFAVTTLTQTNTAPVLQPISNQNAVVNTQLTFTAQASDPDGDTLTFSLGSNAPAGASINSSTGVFTWTPTTTGTFTFDVIVSDGTFTATQSVTINVTTTPQPVTTVTPGKGDNNHHCGTVVCKKFRDYRRKYKNDTAKQAFEQVRQIKQTNFKEFQRLEGIYLAYKDFSKSELAALSAKVQADFHLFQNYNGYRHYKSLRDKV